LPVLENLVERKNLSESEAENAMRTILWGEATAPQIAAFLTAMRMKGETVEELVGFARAMRRVAVRVDCGINGQTLLDTCGTGGEDFEPFTVWTLVGLGAAGEVVRSAKHGTRSISSQCGSAALLESLGIEIAIPPEQSARAIREVGIGFLFAPAIHKSMKHA